MWKALGALALAMTLTAGIAAADLSPTYTGPESTAEKSFVAAVQADLAKRFPTAADAEKSGYVRYTNEDDTGAISYANMHWQSGDARHPSQLWYGTDGRILGADFSVLKTASSARPQLWGVNPGRWYQFDAHIHYVTKDPATGKLSYDLYVPNDKFAAAGGDVTHPAAATLVKLGRVKSTADVLTVFEFPSIWDLIVWVKPNPSGAFAEKNPLVHPSQPAK